MEAGTTAFPSPSYLKGDVTYYITDLPSYSSLATCAQFAVSYEVMSLGNDGGDCPSAPLGFVSCACVKDQVGIGGEFFSCSDLSHDFLPRHGLSRKNPI